jgi:hypothetical protein
LVRRARVDGKLLLPVICNLSTWAINRRPLDQWLAEDLIETYQVPRAVAQSWVASQEVLPLLDGLDEVDAAQRAACMEAINTFHQAHAQLPLVVCSRIQEFRAQGVPLPLRRAVVVQPLTDEQIQAYLAYGGAELAALRAAVQADAALRDVVRTPLLLRVVALTYEGLPPEAIPPVDDREAWVQQVFGEYVARMLKRRRRLEVATADSPEEVEAPEYAAEQVEQCLAWLARQIRRHGQVELYLGRLQPDWLPDARTRRLYRLASTVRVGLYVGVLWALGGVLIGGPLSQVLAVGLLGGVLYGLFVWVFVVLSFDEDQWSIAKRTIDVSRRHPADQFARQRSQQLKEQAYQTPNEGIRRSMRIGVGVVLVCTLSG